MSMWAEVLVVQIGCMSSPHAVVNLAGLLNYQVIGNEDIYYQAFCDGWTLRCELMLK